MKNQFALTNGLLPSIRFGLSLAGILLLAMATSSSARPAPEVLLPSSLPYGYSYEEWSAKFWQFNLGQSSKHYEVLGAPDICSGPASKVRFPGPNILGGDAIHVTTNHITIPAGTPLFFPVFCLWQDNGNCPLTAFTTFTADCCRSVAALLPFLLPVISLTINRVADVATFPSFMLIVVLSTGPSQACRGRV
jgi:hypothetical protein